MWLFLPDVFLKEKNKHIHTRMILLFLAILNSRWVLAEISRQGDKPRRMVVMEGLNQSHWHHRVTWQGAHHTYFNKGCSFSSIISKVHICIYTHTQTHIHLNIKLMKLCFDWNRFLKYSSNANAFLLTPTPSVFHPGHMGQVLPRLASRPAGHKADCPGPPTACVHKKLSVTGPLTTFTGILVKPGSTVYKIQLHLALRNIPDKIWFKRMEKVTFPWKTLKFY